MPKKPAILHTPSQSLETLCEELLKAKPNQEKVRQLMTDIEIPYTSDPIQQMATVLQLMDQKKSKTKPSDRAAEL